MLSNRIINGIFLALCVAFILVLGAVIFVARERTDQIIDRLSVERIVASKEGFTSYIDDLANRAMLRGGVFANQQRLIEAITEYNDNDFVLTDENYNTMLELSNEFLHGVDFISITDMNGIALARTDNGEREYPLPKNGYSLMTNPDVQQVFETGEPVSAFTFMIDNTTLVVASLYPIYDEDMLIGLVTCLFDMTNPKHINAYKEQSGVEAAIFLGQEEFVSTFSSAEQPVSLVAGTQVIEAIFTNGEDSYINYKKINDTTHGVCFTPLVYRGEVIGMVFIGIDIEAAVSIQTEMNAYFFYIAAMAVVVVFVFVLILRRYNNMINKQIALKNQMSDILQSFLSGEDIDTLIPKALRELGVLVDIPSILLFRKKASENGSQQSGEDFVCTNEWIDSSLNMPSRIGEGLSVSPGMLKIYKAQKNNKEFCITSDNPRVKEALSQYRVHFQNYLVTCIYLDEEVYALLDFSRASKRKKWKKDDINAATFLTITLTSALRKNMIEEELVEAKNIAERNSQYKSSFLANVSHEIRTPMNAILGIAKIHLQEKSSRTEIEEGLAMIYDSGNLLLGIINDILDLSKIESGMMDIHPTKYDIPSLINDMVQICRLRYGSKPIDFSLDIDKNTPLNLYGDDLRIRQVLGNILSNAFKYTDSGTIVLSVSSDRADISDQDSDTSESSADNVMLIFRVKDTGQGMSQEQVEVLFDEFTRFNVEINRTTVGTGLGMSITKQLLDLMNGDVTVESKPNEGTTITVYIPQERCDTYVCGPEMSERLNSFKFHSVSLTKRSQTTYEYMPYGTVLIVDDVESNLYVAKGMLVPYGLQIETASSGFEAIDHIVNGKTYDVILMDHMMPRMDGVETVKNIRQMGYKGYIIALTANALTGQKEMFLDNDFDGYLPKPVDTRELNSMLMEFIRNKKPVDVVNAAREEAREAELLRTLDSADSKKEAAEKIKADMREIHEAFISDAESAVNLMEECHEDLCAGNEMDCNMYRITVHGMKTVLRYLDEKDLSDFALELEKAATDKNMGVILAKTPIFVDLLKAVVEKVKDKD